MKSLQNFFRILASAAAAVCLVLGTAAGVLGAQSPDEYQVTSGSELSVPIPGLTVEKESAPPGNRLMLFGSVPVKNVAVSVSPETCVTVCGTPFGMKMFTDGVVVVGTSDIQSGGKICNPAAAAGIKTGDVIVSVDGRRVGQNEDVARLIEDSAGKKVEISALRGEKEITAELSPVKSDADHRYRGGLWVRDSTAGIGTVTFYDVRTGLFGGLGHGICDVDTGELLPLGSGEIVPVAISGIVRGERGKAGELRGYFTGNSSEGTLFVNGGAGVYGRLDSPCLRGRTAVVAMRQEVVPGPVKILCTLDDRGPREYDARIESVNYRENRTGKNLVLCVTDPELLSLAGGIIQGMSGSPVLQNGKLAGAVTHVFVNDPTRGYGIFAETMLEREELVADQKAS